MIQLLQRHRPSVVHHKLLTGDTEHAAVWPWSALLKPGILVVLTW